MKFSTMLLKISYATELMRWLQWRIRRPKRPEDLQVDRYVPVIQSQLNASNIRRQPNHKTVFPVRGIAIFLITFRFFPERELKTRVRALRDVKGRRRWRKNNPDRNWSGLSWPNIRQPRRSISRVKRSSELCGGRRNGNRKRDGHKIGRRTALPED